MSRVTHIVATVAPWQHCSPHGGFITTSTILADQLEPGMVVDDAGCFCPLVAVWCDVPSRHVVAAVRLPDGQVERRLVTHLRVRDDMRWEPLPVSRCGCWASPTGRWTCDRHLRRRRLRREAARRPRSSRPLWHLARTERTPMAITTVTEAAAVNTLLRYFTGTAAHGLPVPTQAEARAAAEVLAAAASRRLSAGLRAADISRIWPSPVLYAVTRADADRLAGRPISDDEADRLATALANSSIPDAVATVVAAVTDSD